MATFRNALFLSLIAAMLVISSCGSLSPRGGKTSSSDGEDDKGETGDIGSSGQMGPQGPKGSKGDRGPSNPVVTIGLFDNNDELIGYKFNDGTVADVFLVDGTRALIDVDSGELQAMSPFDLHCLYESNNCSGQCYVYDSRWLNLLVVDDNGNPRYAPRGTANTGAKTMESYVDENNMCVVNTIATTESYGTQAYPNAANVPFTAPLYWGLSEE